MSTSLRLVVQLLGPALWFFPASAAGQFFPGMSVDSAMITVTGSAEVPLVPDRAVLYVSLAGRDASGAAAIQQAGAARERVGQALREIGYPVDRIQPWGLGFGERPQMGPRMPGPEGPEEQVALLGLRIPVEPIDGLDAVLQALARSGIEGVRYAAFESSQANAARERATRQAVQQAREQAQVMADAAGVRLGELRSLSAAPDFGEVNAEVRFLSFGNPFERGAVLVPSNPVLRVTVFGGWAIRPR